MKMEGGLVQHQATDIEVQCLPGDIPEYIEVDMLELETGQIVHLSDVTLPAGRDVRSPVTGRDHTTWPSPLYWHPRAVTKRRGRARLIPPRAQRATLKKARRGRRQRGLIASLRHSAAAPALTAIKLIVGLGNPGGEYRGTRHNAGADFVEALARDCAVNLQDESKFYGMTGRGHFAGHDLRLLVPTTFMNRSGQGGSGHGQFLQDRPRRDADRP